MELTCPKCHGAMRTYERNGVHVDQCGECRGIFLDRGELERLVDAETSWHTREPSSPPGAHGASGATGGAAPASKEQSPAAQLGAVVSEVLQQRNQRSTHYGSGYGQPRRKKKSFLDELFG